MKRRSFIGALVATFVTPAEMLKPQVPVIPAGFIYFTTDEYARWCERAYRVTPSRPPVFSGEIGHYNGIRFTRSIG